MEDDRAEARACGAPIVVVSGLPRSGTSLLMQMLGAAGVPLLVDRERAADPDNPRGYFEYAPVKRLRADASFLEAAVGRAVKIVAPLVTALPDRYRYRIVRVERDLDEVLASQRAMLQRRGAGWDAASEPAMRRAFEGALASVDDWIARAPHVQVCVVSHAELLSSPYTAAQHILDLLGRNEDPDARETLAAMAAVVDERLHRHRHRHRHRNRHRHRRQHP